MPIEQGTGRLSSHKTIVKAIGRAASYVNDPAVAKEAKIFLQEALTATQ